MSGGQKDPGFKPGGLPGVPGDPERLNRLRASVEAFRGWHARFEYPRFESENVHGDPPPLAPSSLPRREESPVCVCSHRKSGHREGSFDFKPGCWNCRECTGFVEAAG